MVFKMSLMGAHGIMSTNVFNKFVISGESIDSPFLVYEISI
jgi:hypothetical protein